MAKLAKEDDFAAENGPPPAAENGTPTAAEDGPPTAAEDGPPTAAEDGFQWEKDPHATRTCPHDGCLDRLEGAFQLAQHFVKEHEDAALWPPATTMLDFGIRRCKNSHCKKMYNRASKYAGEAWVCHQRKCRCERSPQKNEIATDEGQYKRPESRKVHTCPHDGCLAHLTGASALITHLLRCHADVALWPPATTMLEYGIRRCKSSHCKKMQTKKKDWKKHLRKCHHLGEVEAIGWCSEINKLKQKTRAQRKKQVVTAAPVLITYAAAAGGSQGEARRSAVACEHVEPTRLLEEGAEGGGQAHGFVAEEAHARVPPQSTRDGASPSEGRLRQKRKRHLLAVALLHAKAEAAMLELYALQPSLREDATALMEEAAVAAVTAAAAAADEREVEKRRRLTVTAAAAVDAAVNPNAATDSSAAPAEVPAATEGAEAAAFGVGVAAVAAADAAADAAVSGVERRKLILEFFPRKRSSQKRSRGSTPVLVDNGPRHSMGLGRGLSAALPAWKTRLGGTWPLPRPPVGQSREAGKVTMPVEAGTVEAGTQGTATTAGAAATAATEAVTPAATDDTATATAGA
jgi:hypothetical protein